MIDLTDYETRMSDALRSLQKALGALRTDRASPALLDGVQMPSGQPLRAIASISVPEPRLLTVTVWDASNAAQVAKAIMSAGLGLNGVQDGSTIRVPIPALTEDRRNELRAQARRLAEGHRQTVRSIRRDAMDAVKATPSRDEGKALEVRIQQMTDAVIAKIDAAVSAREVAP